MSQARQPFDELYDRHFQVIFRYVLRRVANVAEAEDLTAQTFYKALRGFWRFRWTGGNVSAWLYRIATNEVASHYRRQHADPGASPEAYRPASTSAHGDDPTDAWAAELNDAEQELSVNRLYLDLHRALRRLAPGDQALIVLRFFEQKSYDEIAPILGSRPGTLAMRANRALKKLKKELQQRGIDHEELRGILASVERPGPAGRRIPAQAAQ